MNDHARCRLVAGPQDGSGKTQQSGIPLGKGAEKALRVGTEKRCLYEAEFIFNLLRRYLRLLK